MHSQEVFFGVIVEHKQITPYKIPVETFYRELLGWWSETTAKWDGQLKAYRNSAGNIVPDDKDFVLDITFAGNTGEIESYVELAATYYHVKGEYNAQGLITGTVNYGGFTGVGTATVAPDENNSEGILTGLIGEQGAVGVFISNGAGSTKEALVATTGTAYVGGFVAAPYIPEADDFPRKVTFNDWVRDFGRSPPPTSLDTSVSATDRKRQFLAGGTEVLDTTGTGSIDTPTVRNLTLASAMYNRAPLTTTGDANDGYGLLVDTVGTDNYVYYAGILSGTDLGAPLIQTSGKFDWHGQIQIIRQNSLETPGPQNFTLHITLGAIDGIAGSAGSISGFYGEYSAGPPISRIREYRLAGTYYTHGVIDGTVLYTTIVGNNEPINSSGFLTGLMGEQGAVGVFIAGTGTKESIIGAASARTATLYTGGFVVSGAAPPPVYVPPGDNDTGKVAFNDWLRDFGENPPPLTLRETNPPADRKNEFLAGGTTGLSTMGVNSVENDAKSSLTLNSARYDGAVLGGTGDINDGIAFFYDTIAAGNYNYYAGLLSDTDLGAPITGTATTTAKWEGQLRAFRDANSIATDDIDFVLDITFAGNTGSIESYAEVVTATYYHVDGTYNARGVISGTVERGIFQGVGTGTVSELGISSEGILTGLIGEQGAVGVFIADDDAPTAYVGGFVAAPIRSIPNYDTFVRHYEPQKNADNTKLLDSTVDTDRLNQFLKGQESGITFPLSVQTLLYYDATGHFSTVALKLEGDSVNGIGLVRAFAEVQQMREIHRSGILLGTDLGAPLTGNETDANWSGKLYVTRHVNASDNNKPIAIDLELAVDFSAGTIRTANAVTTAPNETVAISGTFGAGDVTLPAGVMGGTVSYNDGATTYNALPLIGLIGEDGAIGVFHGGEGVLLPMAGGFIVKPPE